MRTYFISEVMKFIVDELDLNLAGGLGQYQNLNSKFVTKIEICE